MRHHGHAVTRPCRQASGRQAPPPHATALGNKPGEVRRKLPPPAEKTSLSRRAKYIQKFCLYIQNFCLYKQKFCFNIQKFCFYFTHRGKEVFSAGGGSLCLSSRALSADMADLMRAAALQTCGTSARDVSDLARDRQTAMPHRHWQRAAGRQRKKLWHDGACSRFICTFAPVKRKRSLAQLVARYVRDVEVGRSSRLTPTCKAAGMMPAAFVVWQKQ